MFAHPPSFPLALPSFLPTSSKHCLSMRPYVRHVLLRHAPTAAFAGGTAQWKVDERRRGVGKQRVQKGFAYCLKCTDTDTRHRGEDG
jgi:hypothetical protein